MMLRAYPYLKVLIYQCNMRMILLLMITINHVDGDAHDTLALSQLNVESDVLSLDDSLSTMLVAKQVSCVKNSWWMKLWLLILQSKIRAVILSKMVCYSTRPRFLIIQLNDWLYRREGADP